MMPGFTPYDFAEMGEAMGLDEQSEVPIRTLLVDCYSLPRQALRNALRLEPMVSVVGDTDDVVVGLRLAKRLQPQAVIMEISMRGLSGFEATKVLKQQLPYVQVILMSAVYSHAEAASEARRCGASLFWNKMSNVYVDLIPRMFSLFRPHILAS
ncbi:MAG: response regulator [Dehalococcoidia bacterium]